jgi:heat shock protein 1/8
LENYLYSTRNSLTEGETPIKETDDLKTIEDTVTSGIEWLELNQTAEKEEYDAKKKECEDLITPILTKMYQSAQESTQNTQENRQPTGEPIIEEMD